MDSVRQKSNVSSPSLRTFASPAMLKIKLSRFYKRKIAVATPYRNDEALLRICKNIDAYFESSEVTILKNDHSSTVIKIKLEETEYVARRDNFVNIITFSRRLFKKSRARKVWEKAQFANSLGLKTINPLAYIEDYCFFLRSKSYVVSEYLHGTTLEVFLSDPNVPDSIKEKNAHEIVQTMKEWHGAGITHGDPKAANVMINKEGISLMDVEDMKAFRRGLFLRHAITRDKCIILLNWQNDPKLRSIWVRRFALEHSSGLNYFGKYLIKRYWKNEFRILSSTYSKKVDANIIITQQKPTRTSDKAYGSQKDSCILSENDPWCLITTKKAFYFVKSEKEYIGKRRIPKKGILSMTVALRICGFELPSVIDGGIDKNCEYVVVGQQEGVSLQGAWRKIESDPEEVKHRFLTNVAEEIGRLHAMGFSGVISSVESIFIQHKDSMLQTGFKLNGNIRWRQGFGLRHSSKEIDILKNEFLSKLPKEYEALFLSKYHEVLSKS